MIENVGVSKKEGEFWQINLPSPSYISLEKGTDDWLLAVSQPAGSPGGGPAPLSI